MCVILLQLFGELVLSYITHLVAFHVIFLSTDKKIEKLDTDDLDEIEKIAS